MTARRLPPERVVPPSGASIPESSKSLLERAPPAGRSVDGRQGARVLLGLTDTTLRGQLSGQLLRDGHVVAAAADGVQLLERLADRVLEGSDRPWPDIIIADADLPGRGGIDLLADLRAVGWPTPFVLIARPEDPDLVDAEARYGGLAVFEDPCDASDVLTAVAVLLHGVGVALWYPDGAHSSQAYVGSGAWGHDDASPSKQA